MPQESKGNMNKAAARRSAKRSPGKTERKTWTTIHNKERRLKRHIDRHPGDKCAGLAIKNL
jgi:hypothetical protein